MHSKLKFINIFTLYQQSILNLGVKELAWVLKKSNKTIYAELSLENLETYLETMKNYDDLGVKPPYLPKLGLVDFMIGIALTKDFSALIAIAKEFNYACFPLPSNKEVSKEAAARAVSKISQMANKEAAESFNSVMDALSGDGIIDKKEAKTASDECLEAINALSELKAYLDQLKKAGAK